MYKRVKLDEKDSFLEIKIIFNQWNAVIINNKKEIVKKVSEEEFVRGFIYNGFKINGTLNKKWFLFDPIFDFYINDVLNIESDHSLESQIKYGRGLSLLFLLGGCILSLVVFFLQNIAINKYILAFLKCFSLFISLSQPTVVTMMLSVIVPLLILLFLAKSKFEKWTLYLWGLILLVDSIMSYEPSLQVGPFIIIVRYFIVSKYLFVLLSELVRSKKTKSL